MPELPEVETIRRGLQRLILNKKIIRVKINAEKSFRGDKDKLVGAEIIDVQRRGKAMIMPLRGAKEQYYLMAHMRMTGQMVVLPPKGAERFSAGHPSADFFNTEPGKHTRVEIYFIDGTKLFFNDLRKFGFLKVLNEDELKNDAFLTSLGEEPDKMQKAQFWQMLQRHQKAPIKAVLLDQKNIAGVGNIYADEGCFAAKILPMRKAGTLKRAEADALLDGIVAVMRRSIESGGSTMKDYVKADGTRGDYLTKFAQVFRRQGEKCRRCGVEIKKTKVAGRGTHYCPGCQK